MRSLKRLFLCFFCACVVSAGFAQSEDSTKHFIDYLTQEKAKLTQLSQNTTTTPNVPGTAYQLMLRKQQNKAMLALVEAKMASLDSFLVHQRKQQQQLSSRLKTLQQSPLGPSEGREVQEQINQIKALNEVNNRIIVLLNDNAALAERQHTALETESRELEVFQAKIDEKQRLNELNKRIEVLEQARADLYRKNVEPQGKKPDTSFNGNLNREAAVLLNNQAIILIQYRMTELELQKKLINAEYLLIKDQHSKTIQSVIDTYKSAIHQLGLIQDALKKMVESLKNEAALVPDSQLKQRYSSIQQTAVMRLTEVSSQLKTLQQDLAKKQQQLKKQLSVRQGLTEYELEGWSAFFNQMLLIPAKFIHYLSSLSLKIKDNFEWLDKWVALCYGLILLGIVVTAVMLRRMLSRVSRSKERLRLSGHLFDAVLNLLYRNIPHLSLLAIAMVTFTLNRIPSNNYNLFINLVLVWITFRSLILLARSVLLENQDSSRQGVRFYRQIKGLLLVGGWMTALMLMSHQLPLSFLLQDTFNRLFMSFLLALSLIAWKSKEVIPHVTRSILRTQKRYFSNAMWLFSVLIPLILFSTAVMGVLGYIDLAWTLSRYQAYLLLLLTSYLVLRGLMFDALELVSEWMIDSFSSAWLWIEVILKPLDKILRVALLLLCIMVLFHLLGWSSDAVVMSRFYQGLNYPLVNTSGVHITSVSIIQFILLLCLFIWIAKWTREFCYRWLYRETKDAGIRNSLSVFTQYAVILIGSFITLRALGLDFSGMSMVLGGLAVGMGFGLRDFASNIVGGIMLLIERPVREGDLITLGEYEGRVAHIGIRSMRVSSWDNMEVLIPNAETFNKPFTNWTHQDNVVRTVVPIKVNRTDDPIMIQQLILDLLAIVPEVLAEPEPQVFLKQIDEALIEFEVRYHINVVSHTRFEVRSKVLFAIMAQFKAAGIKPPIPPFSVELNAVTQTPLSTPER